MGYRRRQGADLLSDPLLQRQAELGALGFAEALRAVGFSRGRRALRVQRRDRRRLRSLGRRPESWRSGAVRGRLVARRMAAEVPKLDLHGFAINPMVKAIG